jgi:hypothetical protein
MAFNQFVNLHGLEWLLMIFNDSAHCLQLFSLIMRDSIDSNATESAVCVAHYFLISFNISSDSEWFQMILNDFYRFLGISSTNSKIKS